MLILLLVIVWFMFLMVLYLLSTIVIPILVVASNPLYVTISRVLIGALIILAWILIWHRLAEFWFYKVLRRK